MSLSAGVFMIKQILAVSLLSLSLNPLFSKTKMNISLEDQSDFPYIIGTGDSLQKVNPGITIEMLHMIAKDMDIDLSLERKPWKRCLADMQSNRSDGCFSASYKKEREELGVYPKAGDKVDDSKSLMNSSYSFYAKKEANIGWKKGDFSTLKGKQIGYIRGFSVGEVLKEQKLEKLSDFKDIKQALNMLSLGRVDALALISVSADNEISINSKFSNIEKLEPVISSKPYYLMFSKGFYEKNKKLCEAFWQKIKEYRDSDKVKKLGKKYFEKAN